jgi:hypothetical protein
LVTQARGSHGVVVFFWAAACADHILTILFISAATPTSSVATIDNMALFSETKVAHQRDDLLSEPATSFEEAYSEALKKKILPYVDA